jgi:hypothetical protein
MGGIHPNLLVRFFPVPVWFVGALPVQFHHNQVHRQGFHSQMRVLYRRHLLHDDHQVAKRLLFVGLRGFSRPELQGIPKFRKNEIKVKVPLRSTKQAENQQNQTTALARTDLQLSEEQGNLKFRHLLFVVYCLATFRTKAEIPFLFVEAFPGRAISALTVNSAEKWMRRLDADPDLALKGKDKRWKELWLQFCDQRKSYLGTIKDIPLAHPRKRIEALVDLFGEIQPRPVRALPIRESVTDEEGLPRRDSKGREILRTRTELVSEKDIPTALQCLKQIGVESGTYIEKSETQLTFRDLIKRRRQERGFKNEVSDANVVEESFDDADMPEVELSLPCPITMPQAEYDHV